MIDIELIKKQAKYELARREFWEYCKLKAPDFYMEERPFLKDLCSTLQSFYESDGRVMIINMPPRHGKSRTVGCFVEWVLGNNINEKIMTGSYNEKLSTTLSRGVRDTIQTVKADEDITVFNDIFPRCQIQRGDGAVNMWSLVGGYNNYLATSPDATSTGYGCDLMILDDMLKNAMEAHNINKLDNIWDWYTDTMVSRLEEGGKLIVVMTRWATKDLCGRLIKHYGAKAKVIKYKALQSNNEMLCPDILSRESYEDKKLLQSIDIVKANYDQEPIDIKGKLYTRFKTYETLPTDSNGQTLFTCIKNYTDTADTGSDYLCSIDYGVYNKEAYILSILFTKASMETTESEQAKQLVADKVNIADIESNNGGRGYARNVERIMLDKFNWNKTRIQPFHQSKNKNARILSNSTWIMDHVYYPVNWKDKYPEYYVAMNEYQKEGKNKHDDAQDATTGIAEKISIGELFSFD